MVFPVRVSGLNCVIVMLPVMRMVAGKFGMPKSVPVACAGKKAGTSLHGSSNDVPTVKLPEKGGNLSVIISLLSNAQKITSLKIVYRVP